MKHKQPVHSAMRIFDSFNKFLDEGFKSNYFETIDKQRPENDRGIVTAARVLQAQFHRSTHFYLPESTLMSGKDKSEYRHMVRLPYERTAILMHMPELNQSFITMAFNYSYPGANLQRINSAVTSGFVWRPEHRMISAVYARKPDAEIVKRWNVEPGHNVPENFWMVGSAAFVWNLDQTYPVPIYLPFFGVKNDEDRVKGAKWAEYAIFLLCALLSLHNVKTQENFPPEKLNRNRLRSNVLPLKSFHTLIVDGEHWDSTTGTGEGSGMRSHLRRGHIRRLDESRNVWVRATTVQGSRPGFVEKSYAIKPPEET